MIWHEKRGFATKKVTVRNQSKSRHETFYREPTLGEDADHNNSEFLAEMSNDDSYVGLFFFYFSGGPWQISPSLVECVYLYQLRHKYLVRLPLPQGGKQKARIVTEGERGEGRREDGRGCKVEMGDGRGERM
jgi:hypothetical protein